MDTTQTTIINQLGFKTSDISLIIGASRYFSPRFGVSMRHTVSMTPFYNNPNPTTTTSQIPSGYGGFRNYFLSINLFYDFVEPKMVVKREKRPLSKRSAIINFLSRLLIFNKVMFENMQNNILRLWRGLQVNVIS